MNGKKNKIKYREIGRLCVKVIVFALCFTTVFSGAGLGLIVADAADNFGAIPVPTGYVDPATGYDPWEEEPYTVIDEPEESGGKVSGKKFLLTVSTGISGGDAVQYFAVRYVDDNGVERSQFVFPHNGAMAEGYSLAEKVPGADSTQMKRRLQTVAETTGYQPIWSAEDNNAGTVKDGLQPFSTDMYLFELYFGFSKFVCIDMFMQHGESISVNTKNEWTCRDIRLYRVQNVNSVKMTGYYSSDYYIDFDGELLTKFDMKQENSGDFSVAKSDKLFRIGKDVNVVYGLKTDIASDEKNYSGKGSNKELLFRLDFADTYGSGIESLASEIKDKKASLKSLNLCEALGIQFEYEDIYGIKRQTILPVITSFVGWASEQNENIASMSFIGVAQQGDTILFAGNFPDYQKMTGYKLIYGENAAQQAHVTCKSGNSREKERQTALAQDAMSYVGLSIYDNAAADTDVFADGAILRCTASGTPIYYFKTVNTAGNELRSGVPVSMYNEFKHIEAGDERAVTLLPLNANNGYIFEIQTDDIAAAATTADITMTLTYVDTVGEEKLCAPISAKEVVRNFYGYWPGSTGDIAYYAGTSAGGLMVFEVNYSDVDYFKSIELSIDGSSADEWQLSSINIYRVNSVSHRYANWLTVDRTIQGITTDREFNRDYSKEEPMVNYEKKILLSDRRRSVTIKFDESGSSPQTKETELDWTKLSESMTYNETRQDLGFTKARYNYQINVTVASNNTLNEGDDDCGSNNKFYFQLVFQDGTTAYVQANQQIMADGFRAGKTESFSIVANRNYGDLKALRIIPDDTQDDSDINDKLKIKDIVIVQTGTGGVSSSWKVEEVGWIEIDYRDSGAKTTVKGEKLRAESEMARTERITGKGYSMDFMVALSTGLYDAGSSQYHGMLVADVVYLNTNGEYRTVSLDVVKAIADYANRAISPGEMDINAHSAYSSKSLYMSDPSFMFRENKTDRFLITLDDVKSILRMTFYVAGDVNTKWRVSTVDIYNIVEDGVVVLNTKSEYQHEGEVKPLCASQSVEGYECISGYDANQKRTTVQEFDVNFSENTITVEQETWASVIEREPTSNDDTVNMYIYFDENTPDVMLQTLNINAAVQYQQRDTDRIYQAVASGLEISTEKKMAYAIGFSARGMGNLHDVTLKTDDNAKISYVVVQHVRSGVVIDNYYIPFFDTDASYAPITSTPGARPDVIREEQIISLQFAQDTVTKALDSATNIAVSFTYTTVNDVTKREYESPFVFLTDQEIRQIKKGQVVDISYRQKYVKDITKLTFAAVGTVNATVKSAVAMTYVTDIDNNTARTGCFSFDTITPITRTRYSVAATDSQIASLAVNFKTMDNGTFESLGDTKVLMRIGVVDNFGDNVELEYNDIFNFGANGNVAAGEKISVRMLLSNVNAIRYIYVEPVSTGSALSSTWPLESVTAKWIVNGSETSISREVNAYVEEGSGCTINCAAVGVMVSASVRNPDGSLSGMNRTVTNKSLDFELTGGQYIRLTPTALNSVNGYACRVTAARISGGNEEFTLRRDGNVYIFTPKPHYSGDATYQITVKSEEDSTKSVTIMVKVLESELPQEPVTEELTTQEPTTEQPATEPPTEKPADEETTTEKIPDEPETVTGAEEPGTEEIETLSPPIKPPETTTLVPEKPVNNTDPVPPSEPEEGGTEEEPLG